MTHADIWKRVHTFNIHSEEQLPFYYDYIS